MNGKLEAYERAHHSETQCLEQKMEALRTRLAKLERRQTRKMPKLKGWAE